MVRGMTFLVLFVLACLSGLAAEVHLKSGVSVQGTIIEQGTDKVILDADGVRLTYYNDEIESVDTKDQGTSDFPQPRNTVAADDRPVLPPSDAAAVFQPEDTSAKGTVGQIDALLDEYDAVIKKYEAEVFTTQRMMQMQVDVVAWGQKFNFVTQAQPSEVARVQDRLNGLNARMMQLYQHVQ